MKSWATSSFGDGLLLGLVEKLAVGVEMVQPTQPGYFEWFGVVGVVALDVLGGAADSAGTLGEHTELDRQKGHSGRQLVLAWTETLCLSDSTLLVVPVLLRHGSCVGTVAREAVRVDTAGSRRILRILT